MTAPNPEEARIKASSHGAAGAGTGRGDAPAASVVIICYNHGKYLGEAVESALAQTLKDVEIVVVDDGSTDDTPAIAARYPSVRYVHQGNQGMAAARNTGLRASRGRYVSFLDADDRLLPDALRAGASSLEAHPDCAFVSGHYRMIAADGTPIPTESRPCVSKDHYRVLLERNYIGMHATVLFRRDILEKSSVFDRRLRGCDDYEIYLRIAREFPVYCHDAVVAEYRRHGSNLSQNYAMMLDSTLGILGRHRRSAFETPGLAASYLEGVRHWRGLYSDRLVRQVLGQLRSPSRWPSALRGAAVLLRRDPMAVVRHLRRRLQRR